MNNIKVPLKVKYYHVLVGKSNSGEEFYVNMGSYNPPKPKQIYYGQKYQL